MMTKIYLTFGIYLWLSFLIVSVPSMQETKVQKYMITHESIYDRDIKKNEFKKYTGRWPPENTQIEGVAESILEVYYNKIVIKEYYHHAYCGEQTQIFRFTPVNIDTKLAISSAKYTLDGVYGNCEDEHEIHYGIATIKSDDLSLKDLLSGNIKAGTIITFWKFIPSKKEGEKMAIKIKKWRILKQK